MKRRILIEVDVNDDINGAMLNILLSIQGTLNGQQTTENLIKWGLDLISPAAILPLPDLVPIEVMDVPEP